MASYVGNNTKVANQANKSPSIHSIRSEGSTGMALDGNERIPNYDDHWIYEELILERPPTGGSLGFSIAGGHDNPMYGNNTAIYITKLTPNGISEKDGRMRSVFL
jgi:hypothetical protein